MELATSVQTFICFNDLISNYFVNIYIYSSGVSQELGGQVNHPSPKQLLINRVSAHPRQYAVHKQCTSSARPSLP